MRVKLILPCSDPRLASRVGLGYDGSGHLGFRDLLDRKKRQQRIAKDVQLPNKMVVIGTRREVKQARSTDSEVQNYYIKEKNRMDT